MLKELALYLHSPLSPAYVAFEGELWRTPLSVVTIHGAASLDSIIEILGKISDSAV